MDPLVKRELKKVDPNVPFRASTSHHHHTWARTFHSRPELYIQPESSEEIQKIITLARKCRRRIVTVGCGHSPSDITCTSSWMVNLDKYNQIVSVNQHTKVVVMQAGIRLHELDRELKKYSLAMPNLGSINHQSIAGAIGTATHGSSTRHGILSQSVLGLKIMLSNGHTVSCSAEQNLDLFRAALVSLGALGIITEVTFQAVSRFNIEWQQDLVSINSIKTDWERDLWSKSEFTRVWWFPYMKSAVRWRADKTEKSLRSPKLSWMSGRLGYHVYHILLYMSQYVPRLLPIIEKFVITVQYGNTDSKNSTGSSGVADGHAGLLMNCLYSQFVNEWAIPLAKGPEAITRLSAWLNGEEGSQIPFDSKGLYIHAPIEVRVCDSSTTTPRPYLDNTVPDGPTLYLNATLYRPYNLDPPCHLRYYEAFEWLMKEMGGRPHWAKNFYQVSAEDTHKMYSEMSDWLRVRDEVDPEGMFFGEWHRRYLLQDEEGKSLLPLEEVEVLRQDAKGGGIDWFGEIPSKALSPQNSEESFDLMHGVEAEHSMMLDAGMDEDSALFTKDK
ncbi:D-arabinono-1,4-lactone oxidase [Ptychographa xylographoides]|nr:D-arabinono-1,4-lactone oxidase [Ptychographa xylographoides]